MKAMYRPLLLTFFMFILVVPAAHASDYSSLKTEYINNHPGQAIIPFPWQPITATKVLPFNYSIPVAPENNISITASRNEFESASFVINTQKDIPRIQITATDLYNARGDRIPADAINIRLVKVWYQAGTTVFVDKSRPGGILTPELLLKDDSLVVVDYVNRINYLKVIINGSQRYIDISTPSATFPPDAEIYDAATLQPFSMKTNENKQVWLTVHIPSATNAGDYYGTITLTAPAESPVVLNLKITVLPFDLEPSPLEYSLYYRGKLSTASKTPIGSEWKTAAQYALELRNMKDHGVLYQTLNQDADAMLNTSLLLRSQSGLPKDHIYIGEWNARIGRATDSAGLAKVANTVLKWRSFTSAYGFGTAYFYGYDEVNGQDLVSQRAAWQTVHDNGGKMVTTSWDTTDPVDLTGDILDIANLGIKINATAASEMHTYGHKVFLYNQPQVGVEDPAIYRRNYGYALWNAGYDGAMDYAYQSDAGHHIWNDFDDSGTAIGNVTSYFRDHVFAYPTSNGVIDTIEWEGWREGVDDTRYLATLIKKEGNDLSGRAIVTSSLSSGDTMATIRMKVIDRILFFNSISRSDKIGLYQKCIGAFFLKNSNGGGGADNVFQYGWGGDDLVPLVGDWTGSSVDTVGLYQESTGMFLLKNSNSAGNQDNVFRFGWSSRSGDLIPLVGDWDGDGDDSVGLYEKSTGTFLLKNSNSAGNQDTVFQYGAGGDDWVPLVGDWNNNGDDTVGLYQKSIGGFFLKNSNGAGNADLLFPYGAGGDDWVQLAGDWDGDGDDTVGAYQKSIGAFFLKNSNTYGDADNVFQFGWGSSSGDLVPLIGKWS